MDVKSLLKKVTRRAGRVMEVGVMEERVKGDCDRHVDALYAFLYQLVHDLEHPLELAGSLTKEAFEYQWRTMEKGKFLLSDPWFKENVASIISEQELLLKKEWFQGKDVLDAGCGNGRWSYGLAKLGANITAVDVNEIAIRETQKVLEDIDVEKEYFRSELECVGDKFNGKKFDLVWCWGVLHHCSNFMEALRNVSSLVKEDGVLFLYLYGRESLAMADDIALFKERVIYNTLPTNEQRIEFLMNKSGGDEETLHNYHDVYAPLINRRFEWGTVKRLLEDLGYEDIERTIDYTEIWVRAIKGNSKEYRNKWTLEKKRPPYWFQRSE